MSARLRKKLSKHLPSKVREERLYAKRYSDGQYLSHSFSGWGPKYHVCKACAKASRRA